MCAQALGLPEVPCEVRQVDDNITQRQTILEYNRQRRKTFSQLMREADALEELWQPAAAQDAYITCSHVRTAIDDSLKDADCRDSDDRCRLMQEISRLTKKLPPAKAFKDGPMSLLLVGSRWVARTHTAKLVPFWQLAQKGDVRAQSSLNQLDAGTQDHSCSVQRHAPCATVIQRVFAQLPMTFGPSGTIVPLVFLIRGAFRPQ